jgi:hypothetical protein
MKNTAPFLVVCLVNLLALTSTYGQTIKMSTPQLKNYNVENYLPKLGPAQIKDNSPAHELRRVSITNPLSGNVPKATLIARNQYSDIYRLPIDQMPCVVPNNSVCNKMNISEKGNNDLVENMPNAMQKQNWLPESRTK